MTRALEAIIIMFHFEFRFSGENRGETMVARSSESEKNEGTGLIARPTDELGVLSAGEMARSS